MKRSVFLGSSLAVLLSSLAFAGPVQDWTLAYIQDAPCTYWNGGDGRCLQWYSNYQFFSDYNATLSGFQVYTGSVDDLDARIAALEAKAKPAITSDSNAIPQWTLTSVQDAVCVYWNGRNGDCLRWDTNYQYFPDYNSTLAGFRIYTDAINGLDRRAAALEAKAEPAIKPGSDQIPDWSLTSVQTAPCLLWNSDNGHCQRWYSQYQFFPDYSSEQAGFQLYTAALNSIDKRVAALEGKSAPASSGRTIADSQTSPAKQAF